jgi:hypothetical protein
MFSVPARLGEICHIAGEALHAFDFVQIAGCLRDVVGEFRYRPTLITSGRAFAADIEPVKKDFLGYGISPEDVAVAVGALERAIRDYSAAKAKRAAAIREFEEKLEVAMGYMRRFEALVENILAKNSSVMAEWRVARTIGRVPVRKRAGKPAAPANPPAPPIAA